MTRPGAADPRCCICGNAYGTRFVCGPCKSDPANDGWREAPAREVSFAQIPDDARPVPWGEGEDGQITPMFRRVAVLLLTEREISLREVSRRAGCTESYVRKVQKHCESLRKP